MKPNFKKRYIPLFSLFFLLLVLYSQQSSLNRLGIGLVSKQLREAGIYATFEDASLFVLGIESKKTSLTLPKALLQLPLEELIVSADLASLLSFTLKVYTDFKLYDGKVTGVIFPGSETTRGRIEARSVDVSQMPQLAGLGFTSTLLSVDVPQFQVQPDSKEADVTITIAEIEKPKDTKLTPLLSGLPFTIKLPALSKGRIEFVGKLRKESVTITKFLFTSSLGEVSVEGSTSLKRSGTLALSGKADLTEVGLKKIGSYLPLLSMSKLKSTDQSFEFTVTGATNRPRAAFTLR